MRCSLKRSVTAVLAASFLLLLLLLLHGGSQQEQDHPEVELRGLAPDTILQMLQPEGAQRILRDSDDLSVLHNISYHLLAGSPSPHKKFLAVGLASVRRPRGYYLPATLQSLFKQSTEEELQEMVVVVHLADADPGWNARVAANIAHKFAHQILLGRLLLIHAPHEFYPTLEGLKRNYNDPEERVKFRSKQNVDYAFLLAFSANLSSYYLMIEDDVWCAKSFLTAIRKALASQEGSNWATLEFSKLGYIGKLYRSSDLPRLARFLLLFYQEMPCDWLLVHFRLLLTQKDVIRFKPSLFQHMGLYSSFQGTVNRLEDDEFQADALDLPDNPPAALFTSMSIFENYEPLKAYSTAEGYFWGKDPAAGSVFSVVFQQPARVTRVRVRTGSSERRSDFLHAGVLELGRRQRADGRDCAAYTTVGTFEKGTFERRGLERGMPSPVECVRIRVTRNQSEWLIIQSIDIWTATDT
ncbi:alpha-1,6-mannosyl-glycoprotein 4-beta-N-acetylglucosaminyltransferase-like [Falco biarmicus]|uniref:alpha-1,6-mannosyl-glycoprotein 4-beta-N-acetylglucosaminyltransferase-like n=1 Tax=Falco cherrug TaxID=345164 RepID=UPI0018868770|nr:alpha-1,6-mannosyl-glycoprotein 4-beta-N-acetylglucosaminyltransferase-like [Falco cherrug]XP_027672497.2 alpha-1,6-mannosyl-glycoprotein 4-beta-N-acetylglucosaminyltransferase-like [Falco cherrug]XP_037266141.1 alpha-1,6-mannosyl-glycoprotein 4-beta-N-acetylglucosaminyltransferase-like isoform X1 [Falco rusticolus]XP_055583971.1 alpha-1,6-mannosyl-glycoprotein 4-beta-N-acetylglucosaminyltransferase-like [Falco cherrug]XP_056217477.1 alpha-1,6-mannosyl-glycoprotein 4-beta-N-acetylglucosaminy